MRALRVEGGELHLRLDQPTPTPGADETRVRVDCAGVCATDLALLRGYMGFEGTLGHEFCGSALDGPLAGQRVVGEINAGCGTCAACRNAAGSELDSRHCQARSVLGILGRDGAFADELVLPTRNLLPVPDAVSSAAATFTEPLAAAFEIPAQVDLDTLARGRPARALVIGDGRLGLLCAQVLARLGVDTSILGRHPERAEPLAELPRAPHWIAADADSSGADADGFDLTVEASGRPELLALAFERTRPRGTVVLKTTSEAAAPLNLAPLVINELTLVGSRCGPFAPALEALARGDVVVEPMIHARYPLEEGAAALEHAARPGVLKVLIEPALSPDSATR